MLPKITTASFIEKAKAVHGEKYGYSLVSYINTHTKVKIICRKHGVFEQIPAVHTRLNSPQSCPECGATKRAKALTYTNKEFIKMAQEVHGKRFDYSLVKYVSSKIKITIICPEHGIFEQTPDKHLFGCKCPKCKSTKLRVYNQSDFINRAIKIHGNKYNYSLAKYVGSQSKIIIICPKHGKFEQSPAEHLRGHGCIGCGKIQSTSKKTHTQQDFINTSKSIHGNKYDYSLVKYINSRTKIKIVCHKHGIFEMKPADHLQGQGCRKCKDEEFVHLFRSDTKTFIAAANKVHNNKYDYSLIKYETSAIKVKIICPEHGVWEQLPGNHLQGSGCKKCAGKATLTFDEFITKARSVHGLKYDYSKVIYINNGTFITVVCSIHGKFKIKPNDHINGATGCAACKESKGEKAIRVYLEANKIPFKSQYKLAYGGRLDFYFENQQAAIEYNGKQHYFPNAFGSKKKGIDKENFRDCIQRDIKKAAWCVKHNIALFIIPFWELKNINSILNAYFNGYKYSMKPPPDWITAASKMYY